MLKPVFWHLLLKGFQFNLFLQNAFYLKRRVGQIVTNWRLGNYILQPCTINCENLHSFNLYYHLMLMKCLTNIAT